MSRVIWAALLLCALACAIVVIVHTSRLPVRYGTGYDGTDPGSDCGANPRAVTAVGGGVALFETPGRRIGTLRLRRSVKCATIWGQVLLEPTAAKRLKGRAIKIVAHRPADNLQAPYTLDLHGGTKGFGNQLAASPCVEVTAQLLPGSGHPAGPAARTACK